MTKRTELEAGEVVALMTALALLLKELRELIKLLKRRERADRLLLSDLED